MRRDQPVQFLEKNFWAKTLTGCGELNHLYYLNTEPLTAEGTEEHRAIAKGELRRQIGSSAWGRSFLHRLQLGLYHFIKRPHIVGLAFGEAAVNFHRGKKLVAGHIQGQGGKLFSRISLDAPLPPKPPPHHLPAV